VAWNTLVSEETDFLTEATASLEDSGARIIAETG
jgi:hypothetical protein